MPNLIICDHNALTPAGHYLNYSLCIAGAASAAGMRATMVCHRNLPGALERANSGDGTHAPLPALLPLYTHSWDEAAGIAQDNGTTALVAETLQALALLQAQENDHVLLHTLRLPELTAWLTYLLCASAEESGNGPALHFVLRFDPTPFERDDAPEWQAMRKRLAACREKFSGKVHFWADTQGLAVRYGRQLHQRVGLLPIPFAAAPLRAALARSAIAKRRTPAHVVRPVVVAYLGDARPEKGFGNLPALVAALWQSHIVTGRLRFTIQANTNVAGGQGDTMQAIAALEAYPPQQVELIRHPPSAQEYVNYLADSDIVLLAYDATAYAARSSGILVEALAAGKPVIVSAGTWMATQVDSRHAAVIDHGRQLPAALVALYDRLDDAARAARRVAPAWRRQAGGKYFLDRLAGKSGQDDACADCNDVYRHALDPALPRAAPNPLAGFRDLGELIESCVPVDPALRLAFLAGHGLSPLQRKLAGFGGRLDLLYAASDNGDNAEALAWFVEHVFLPQLAPHGIRLLVTGDVAHQAAWSRHPALACIGAVAEPSLLYHAARLCILPILPAMDGDKEWRLALHAGKPLLGNSAAADALPKELADRMLLTDRPDIFAGMIRRLLQRPRLRARYAARLARAAKADQSMSARHGGHAPSVNALEWNDALQWANRLYLAWLGAPRTAATVPPHGASDAVLSADDRARLLDALPQVLQSAAVDHIGETVRNRLWNNAGGTVDTLLELAGLRTETRSDLQTDWQPSMQRMPSTGRSALFSTRLVRHGAIPGLLIVEAGGHAPPEVRLDDRLLPHKNALHDDAATHVFYYDIAADTAFPLLRPQTLTISLAAGAAERLAGVFFEEHWQIENICRSSRYARYFHALEHDVHGRAFAWTAAPVFLLPMPAWRGVDKMLVLESHALRRNGAADLQRPAGDGEGKFTVTVLNDSAIVTGYLKKRSLISSPGFIELRTAHFEQASDTDRRSIGIAMYGYKAIQQII